MPNQQIFKVIKGAIVPLGRFNLGETKRSSNFEHSNTKSAKPLINKPFSIVAHPLLTSIVNKPPVIINNLIVERFPVIDNPSEINPDSILNDINDNNVKLQFPDIEITPLNKKQVFYYENVFDEKGEISGHLGKVTVNYTIKPKPTTNNLLNISIKIKEAIIHLKINNDTIKINGNIDEANNQITFLLKNEAVKIAFSNLISNFDETKCHIDLFFDFVGYSKITKPPIFSKPNRINLISMLGSSSSFNAPAVNSINIGKKSKSGKTHKNNPTQFYKSTFIVKHSNTINHPLSNDASTSLYQTIDGGFIHNPFNFNEDFSLYEQIFVPGISLDAISIYKSKVTPNEFLLISKRYKITRTADAENAPCINTVFHAAEGDSGLSNDISKISFQFAIGPDLSDYDLQKIKIDLFTNNLLDGDTTNYLDKIQFVYPNDLQNVSYEINGNNYLQNADIAIDGKYFLINFTTENLNDASILINSFNNQLSQYANINFKHKEIRDSSIIELNIQKTIGKIISSTIDNNTKKIILKNHSLSICKISAVLTIDSNKNTHFNSTFFNNYQLLSNEQKEINLNNISTNLATKTIANAFFELESIEDLAKEFSKIVATSNNFNKYIQIQIQAQKNRTSKIQLQLKILATSATFNIEKLKHDFNTPLLINFLLPGNSTITTINYKAIYFDKDNNIVTIHESNFDFSTSSILAIPQK